MESIIKSKPKVDLPPSAASSTLFRYADDTNKYGIKFNYTYADPGLWTNMSGTSNFKYFDKKFFDEGTTIDTNQMTLSLTYGFTRIGDTIKAVGKCPSKYVTLGSMEGVYLLDNKPAIEKKRKWNVSLSAGYMYVPTINKFQPAIGITAGYSIFNWGK